MRHSPDENITISEQLPWLLLFEPIFKKSVFGHRPVGIVFFAYT